MIRAWVDERCDELHEGQSEAMPAAQRSVGERGETCKCVRSMERNRVLMRFEEFRAAGRGVGPGVIACTRNWLPQ